MKKIFLLSFVLLLSVFMNGEGVFAEDDLLCTGRIKGDTVVSVADWNVNSGITSFNDAGDLIMLDLSVMGLGMGYAPSKASAGCTISKENETFMTLADDEFGVKGYAWNTNLGFISMYCDGPGLGPYSNLENNCGNFRYGVKVGADGAQGVGAGNRPLIGYAYNDVFGYINFWCTGGAGGTDGLGNSCGTVPYGVTRASDGTLSGHAYTSAGVYMVFDGITMGLPGELVETDNWCDGTPYVCVEIKPDPRTLDFSLDKDFKLADGTDNYEVHVFLKDKNGNYDPTLYDEKTFFESLDFNWQDTVKLNQLRGNEVGISLNNIVRPFKESDNGGVDYKPINKLAKTSFVDLGNGQFKLNETIRSFAPTSDGNVSQTTSVKPPFLVRNEYFLNQYTVADLDNTWEENRLLLQSVEFVLNDAGGVPVSEVPGIVYPNGQEGLAFKFKPIWELGTLFVNVLEDVIVGYRGIPMSFTFEANQNGPKSFDKPSLDIYLDYDKNATNDTCGTGEDVNFDFYFLKDVYGKDIFSCKSCADGSVPPCFPCVEYDPPTTGLPGQNLLELKDSEKILPAVATLKIVDGQLPCETVAGPGIISVIKYTIDGKEVKYYSNKLPRLGGGVIANPAAFIRGNVYAQIAFSPTAGIETGQYLSTLNFDVVHQSISMNLARALRGKKEINPSKGVCKLVSKAGTLGVTECNIDSDYLSFKVGNEDVLYFKNRDVNIDTISWAGHKNIIVVGGNVYIDGDIYNPSMAGNSLSLVVMSGYDDDFKNAGNVYIAPTVKNIQANIAASGALFSYSGVKSAEGIDTVTGEPVWKSHDERILKLNSQIYFQGSIYSKNTVGGADLTTPRTGGTQTAKPYLLLGTGETVTPGDEGFLVERPQLYDLNYFRLYRLEIRRTPEGLPIDQSCAMGLTPDHIMAINADPFSCPVENGGICCDGIDSLNAVPFGDLVAPEDASLRAKGIPLDQQNSPIYIDYVAPSSDSFIFSTPRR